MVRPEAAAPLCDRCLGRRLVGAAGEAPQKEAGAAARAEAGWPAVAEADCPVCEGAFADFPRWLEVATEAASAYEFSTFQVGTVFPAACEAREKAVAAALGPGEGRGDGSVGETIRTEANRALTAALAEATGTGTAGDGERPDLALLVDTRFWTCEARANSAFVLGRYTKARRDVPQTHWPCKRCQGRGCWQCDDAGVMYESSVEDAVAAVAVPLFGAEGASFHGAGREDIDALMLGDGRPFVLELHDPKRRTVDLSALEVQLHDRAAETGVDAVELVPAAKADVARIKEADYQKEYLAHCEAEAPLTREAVQAAADALAGTTLDQRTPERVSHRRADKVRKRTVHKVTVESWGGESGDDGSRFSLRVLAESGTYIKEMVSGDDGRTAPSFAGLAGTPTRVAYLDVVRILDRDAGDGAA